MISVFIHPIEPFLEIYYMEGRDMAGAMEVTKKKSAGPYLSLENAKKWPFIGTRESVA